MRKNVLLIDDDPDEAELFRDVLTDIDPTISYHFCLSGKAALAGLSGGNFDPDIIFLDINMPEMDGWECVRNLKAMPAYKGIPVYMYSTSKREADRTSARKMGAIDLITKGSDYRKFKEAIAAILDGQSGSSFIRLELFFLILCLGQDLGKRGKHAFPINLNFFYRERTERIICPPVVRLLFRGKPVGYLLRQESSRYLLKYRHVISAFLYYYKFQTNLYNVAYNPFSVWRN